MGLPVPGFIQEIFAAQFEKPLQGNSMTYEHRLIDDMVTGTLKWEEGFIRTRRNDGDVQPDAVVPRFGSPEPIEPARGLAMLIGPERPIVHRAAGLRQARRNLAGPDQSRKVGVNL